MLRMVKVLRGRRGGELDDPMDHDRASALRILMDDGMMRGIARIGCFRVLTNEPAEPPTGRRLFAIDLVDYASDRSVHACVDLDRRGVASLACTPAEPRLAPEEEADALAVALADRRVAGGINLGDEPQSIVHVDAHPHRAAAILFGAQRSSPSLVAVVDLARRTVTKVVPAERW
jgi:hypothetical protein